MTTVSPKGTPRGTVGNVLFLVAMAAIAGIAAWPIYQSLQFVVVVAVATIFSIGAVVLSRARRWSVWAVVAIVAGFFLLTGVPLAVPSALTGLPQVLDGVLQLVSGVVTGWKEIVTISIPAGSYRATLVPAFVVFLVSTTAASWLALRSPKWHELAVPVFLIMQGFGLVFGSSLASAPLNVGPLAIAAPREMAISAMAFAISAVWLIWRSWLARSAALAQAQNASGIRNVSHGRASTVRRLGLAAGMLVVAVLAATAITPALAAGQTRDVLRSAVDPELRVRQELSPLSTYRSYFTDDLYNTTLFTVTGAPEVDRVRLATLSVYDGEAFRVGSTAKSTDPASSFTRVPYTLSPLSPGAATTLEVAMGAYGAVWVPTAGDLVSVSFGGERQQALADSFYYNQQLAAGVELASGGLGDGDNYSLKTVISAPPPLVDLRVATAGPSEANAAVIPQSLVDWVEQQEVSADAAGLQQLIDRLRARGLLSHSLDGSSAGTTYKWVKELSPYSFTPSFAGHSTDRISSLFTALNEKQADIGGDDDSLLVAAVGNDEQFAVAGALLARQLGFDSRVVLGVHLSASGDSEGIPPCEAGRCEGRNVTAWIEVRGADGQWATVDVTPQHTSPLSPDVTLQRDPQVPTEVQPVTAQTVLPAQGLPGDGESTTNETAEAGTDFTWLFAILRVIGIALLVALVISGPVLLILLAKWWRRRSRRSSENPTERITAGWEEYVDTALDFGLPVVHNTTRSELALRHQSDDAHRMATLADRAVFHWEQPEKTDGDEFWLIVESERARLSGGLGWRERAKAMISLRSFTHRVDLRAFALTNRR